MKEFKRKILVITGRKDAFQLAKDTQTAEVSFPFTQFYLFFISDLGKKIINLMKKTTLL